MPTTITKTVKPNGGGDYASLNSALIDNAQDLVANDRIIQFECYAGLDTTPVFVTGYTTDATRYIRYLLSSDRRARRSI